MFHSLLCVLLGPCVLCDHQIIELAAVGCCLAVCGSDGRGGRSRALIPLRRRSICKDLMNLDGYSLLKERIVIGLVPTVVFDRATPIDAEWCVRSRAFSYTQALTRVEIAFLNTIPCPKGVQHCTRRKALNFETGLRDSREDQHTIGPSPSISPVISCP